MEKRKLTPIRLDSYQPLREVVCESLRDAIRRGILKPGERIMEIQLAEELGVSRTPVREAIRKLELEGYVIMMPRRGPYVASMSMRDVNEIFEIRNSMTCFTMLPVIPGSSVSSINCVNSSRVSVHFPCPIRDDSRPRLTNIAPLSRQSHRATAKWQAKQPSIIWKTRKKFS